MVWLSKWAESLNYVMNFHVADTDGVEVQIEIASGSFIKKIIIFIRYKHPNCQ